MPDGGPSPGLEIPAPLHLSKGGAEAWHQLLSQELIREKVISTDFIAFGLLCEAYSETMRLRKETEEWTRSDAETMDVKRWNMVSVALGHSERRLRDWLIAFGLSPTEKRAPVPRGAKPISAKRDDSIDLSKLSDEQRETLGQVMEEVAA